MVKSNLLDFCQHLGLTVYHILAEKALSKSLELKFLN